jgi:hypothetical protein
MIQKLEAGSQQQKQEFQDRINRVATSLTGDLNNATQGVRDHLLKHIDKLSSDTGVHLGDIRQSVQDANARAEAARIETERLRQGSNVFAERTAAEIAKANERVVDLQGETGALGNLLIDADARRVADVNTLASEVVGTQQRLRTTQAQGVSIANDLYRQVERAQGGVEALKGETGALGEAILGMDERVADNGQLSGQGLLDVMQGLRDGRLKLEDMDERVKRAYREGERIAGDLYAQINGLRTPHGPGGGDAGGLAVLAGGHTQRHVGGGYGGEMPALVGPSNQLEYGAAAGGGGYPTLVGPSNQLEYYGPSSTNPALPGPSNQLQNGGVGDDMMDL